MKISAIFTHKKKEKKIPAEELREAEAPEPDMQTEVEEVVVDVDTPEGEVEEGKVTLTPEKGVLRTENLVKRYGKRTVVNHVSIDVTQGEIVGLLGPNGAGKTTTFYMTVGLITPNEGEIFLDNRNITSYLYINARDSA